MRQVNEIILLEQSIYTNIEFAKDPSNSGNNSDKFTFKITCESQPIAMGDYMSAASKNANEVETLEFTIIGNEEIEEFLCGMHYLAEKLGFKSQGVK